MSDKKITADRVIEAVVKTRDEIAAREKEFNDWKKEQQAMQAKREEYLQRLMDEVGTTQFQTAHGTAFKAKKEYANMADWDAFLEWVLTNESYEYLERRVSKKPVKERVDGGETPPPGVNYRTEEVVQVRRK